ncbi:DNA polymerase III subunit alpha [Paenibacillus yanchengensis]|uniref:DNA-directed DNA polymerase n=1 Tax=Paenibacillus yanchengensis TaxID=2035833 RepID=A0ABW4YLZ1_9BACL
MGSISADSGSKSSFVHLHVHSEYSLLDGAARMKELVDRAVDLNMPALALTDHGVMYGAIPFYNYCLERGIKPIIGCEMYITATSRLEKSNRQENPNYHLTVLAKNNVGYHNLIKLSTIGYLEGFYYRPRIDLDILRDHAEGLICLSGCMGGQLSQLLLQGKISEAETLATQYKQVFGEDYYIELQDHGLYEQKKVLPLLKELAEKLQISVVATNDVHYIQAEDEALQDILICIGTGKTVEDEDRLRIASNQLYMRSTDEMSALFRHIPQAITNTRAIADKCELEIVFGKAPLPLYEPLPDSQNATQFLLDLCQQGVVERYGQLLEWQQTTYQATIMERLQYELSIIEKMGFSDYFLIVWDFIRFAHEQGIRTGPGRGSSAGSLVAYVLHITDVDPIKYNLLFERFLNPERISMPDIDIDFDDERRDEVIAYVLDKYGDDHVAQIITFGTMAARAAVRDVGRALRLPIPLVDRTAKQIPAQVGITLTDALKENETLREMYETNPQVERLLKLAIQVEGMPRHASTHAAGVVLSAEPLTHYVPLQTGGSGTLEAQMPITQYSMEHLEALGLLKMDFLGLRTLSIMERAIGFIREQDRIEIDFRNVDDADPTTYQMLGKGETTGIFQLESSGMRKILRDLKPTAFEDIISVLALYRPGPMEFIPTFIASKHGYTQVHYPHPSLAPILQDTYGIIVYQEQIMQIASHMAGFSLGEADLLRRAVSKKNRAILDQERAHFVQGSLRKGYTDDDANVVYDMIVRFADYGFPRAHAAAYGVLAFQTAWLKAHYPVPFMASMLTSVTGNMPKTAQYVEECRRMGLQVLAPDINESLDSFTPRTDHIRFGLGAIKNVGKQAIEAIISEREKEAYSSLLDFCKRVDLRVVNKRVLESLIQAGAFDRLPGHRAQLLGGLEETMAAASKWRKEREELQIELFGLEEVQNWEIELPDIRPFSLMQQLELERELLGIYLSGHPLDDVEPVMEQQSLHRLSQLFDLADGSSIVTLVMIADLKPFTNKRGNAMAFMTVEDRLVQIEAVVFPAVWRRVEAVLTKGKGTIIAIQATVQQEEDSYKLLLDNAIVYEADDRKFLAELTYMKRQIHLRQAKQQPVDKSLPLKSNQRVFIKISAQAEQEERLHRLKQLLQQHKGNYPTILYYERKKQTVALSEQYQVSPTKKMLQEIETLLGKGSVAIK